MAERSKYTLKDYFFQLVTITAGVLIALGVDAVVERRANRALVEEARAMIAREIEDNRRELSGEIDGGTARTKGFEDALQFANAFLAGKQTAIKGLNLGASVPTLNSASWQTAERTGALRYMSYAEVRKYAEVYALQDIFVVQQRRLIEKVIASLAIGGAGDPNRARRSDIEVFRTQLMAIMAEFVAEEVLAKQLREGYEKALTR
jgi:hypothetical protein